MSGNSKEPNQTWICAEKVAYWYLRLNGFLQIENFILHRARGGQRTDADLLGVRFPYRNEFMFDRPADPMVDDNQSLSLSHEILDLLIVEVKSGVDALCKLNGPWTDESKENIHRLLAAIGCVPTKKISAVAKDLYGHGIYNKKGFRVRLVAIGGQRDLDLKIRFPLVSQIVWPELLAFIWTRFHDYKKDKTAVAQWDRTGLRLKRIADGSRNSEEFVATILKKMISCPPIIE